LGFCEIQGEVGLCRLGRRTGRSLTGKEGIVEVKGFEELFDLGGIVREGAYKHHRTAARTEQGVDFPDLGDEFAPLFGGDGLRGIV